MEKVYQDSDLAMGPFPQYPGKIKRRYQCISEAPRRRQPAAIDTIVVDNLLERLNSGAVPLAVPELIE